MLPFASPVVPEVVKLQSPVPVSKPLNAKLLSARQVLEVASSSTSAADKYPKLRVMCLPPLNEYGVSKKADKQLRARKSPSYRTRCPRQVAATEAFGGRTKEKNSRNILRVRGVGNCHICPQPLAHPGYLGGTRGLHVV